MSLPTKQHYIPKAYLKKFSIDPKDRSKKSFIYCAWKDAYNKQRLQDLSIDSSYFKIDDFYTERSNPDIYRFEKFFSEKIEPTYSKIMDEIEGQTNLSNDVRLMLMRWVFYNKYRNLLSREMFTYLEKAFKNVPNPSKSDYYSLFGKTKVDFKTMKPITPKGLHLNFLFSPNLRNYFFEEMEKRSWRVLVAGSDMNFITSDNPGFSMKILPEPEQQSLNGFYAVKEEFANFFVLSPKHCLFISSFIEGTPQDIDFSNELTMYINISNEEVHAINVYTNNVKHNYLISNDKKLLEMYI